MARRAKRALRPNPRIDRNLPSQENVIELDTFQTPRKRKSFPQTRQKVEITHLNEAQRVYSRKIESNDIVIALGAAGTGKTHLAALHAMRGLTEGCYSRIVICRPIINAGGEKLGYLPGGINEKLDPYMRPIFDVFASYWNQRTILNMLSDTKIEIAPLAYMRGRSFIDTFIVADEMENATMDQMFMLLTRLGSGSKLIITGDPIQRDIYGNTLEETIKRLRNIPKVDFVYFDDSDIVRHPTVRYIVEKWPSSDDIPDSVNNDGDDGFPGFIRP